MFGLRKGYGPPSSSSEDSGKEEAVQKVLDNPALGIIPSLQQRKIDVIMNPVLGNSPVGVDTPTETIPTPNLRYSLPKLNVVLADPGQNLDHRGAGDLSSPSESFQSMSTGVTSRSSQRAAREQATSGVRDLTLDSPRSTVRDSVSMNMDPVPFGGSRRGSSSRSSRSMEVDEKTRKSVRVDEVPRRAGGLRNAVLDLEKRMTSKAEIELERREAERTRLLESRENARVARLDAAENARLASLAAREEASEALRKARDAAVRVSSGALIEGNRQRPQFVRRAVYRPKKGGDTQKPRLPRRVVPKKKKCKVVKGVKKCKAVKKK